MLELSHVHKFYRTRSGRSQVLKDINLRVSTSERIGILGRNGSGKSTLIRLIGDAELPSTGDVFRGMSVSWPLAFSGGFQGSLTGLDNLRFICRVYGASYEDALPFVAEFTQLGKYLREPVKSYSSGMLARLAFAMSMAVEFDCFLIDEVFAVGDANFQAKCHRELFERRKDRAMFMVSHDAGMIREHCARACVLEKGILTEFDDVDTAYKYYHEQIASEAGVSVVVPARHEEAGSGGVIGLKLSPAAETENLPGPDMRFDNQNERIITAFYRQIFGRTPDPHGLANHAKWLGERNRETGIDETLRGFLDHREGKDHLRRHNYALPGLGRRVGSPVISNVISLGTHAFTRKFLERFTSGKASAAFDRLFSSPSMIAHAVEDDFAEFLDASHYLFNSHGVDQPDDYNDLLRRVDRFRMALGEGEKTLFLMIRQENEYSQQEFELVRRALKGKSPGCHFIAITVASVLSVDGIPRIDSVIDEDSSCLRRFTAVSPWDPLNFVDEFDELCLYRNIFSHFSLKSEE